MIAMAVRFWRPLAGIAAMLALLATYTAWAGHQRDIGATQERAVWAAQVEAANARVVTVQNAANAARDAQNLKDSQNAKITSDLERKLRDAGRLRDPNAGRCTIGGTTDTTSPGNSSNDTAEASGVLSADLSGLLRDLTREADAVNLAYIASRADADQLRVLLGACGTQTP